VPSISYFFENLAHGITQIQTQLILSSFVLIDFSAIMNSVLQPFYSENIHTNLTRYWDVLCGKCNSGQLRLSSFIHRCCCHAIHSVAQSLTDAHVDKKIRRDIVYISAFMLCCNDVKQLFDLIESIIKIFGDPNQRDAKKKFEKLLLGIQYR
jgi:hypothetical protein